MSVNLPQLDLNCWYNVFSFLDAKENNKITITCKGFENTIATLFQNNIKTMVCKSDLSFGTVVNLTKKYGKTLTELDFEERTHIDINRLKELNIFDEIKEINLASYKGICSETALEQVLKVLGNYKKVEKITLDEDLAGILLKKLPDEICEMFGLESQILSGLCIEHIARDFSERKLKIKIGPYEIDTSNKNERYYSYKLWLPVEQKVYELMSKIPLCDFFLPYDSSKTQPSIGKFSDDFNKFFSPRKFSINSRFEDSMEYIDFFNKTKGPEDVAIAILAGYDEKYKAILNSPFFKTVRNLRMVYPFDQDQKYDFSKFFNTDGVCQKIKKLSLEFWDSDHIIFHDQFLKNLMDDILKNEDSFNKLKTLHLRFRYINTPNEFKSYLRKGFEYITLSSTLSSVNYLENELCLKLHELSKKIPSLNISLKYAYRWRSYHGEQMSASKLAYTGNYEDNKNKYLEMCKEKSIRQ